MLVEKDTLGLTIQSSDQSNKIKFIDSLKQDEVNYIKSQKKNSYNVKKKLKKVQIWKEINLLDLALYLHLETYLTSRNIIPTKRKK